MSGTKRYSVLSVYKELLDGSGEDEPVYVPLGYPVLAHGHPDASPTPGRETGRAGANSDQILHGNLDISNLGKNKTSEI